MPVCRQQHPELNIKYSSSVEEIAGAADALVVVTDWPEFRSLNLAEIATSMTLAILIDGRNMSDPAQPQRSDSPILVLAVGTTGAEEQRWAH